MIRHVWTVLCMRSVIDSDSNNISLFDVVEELQLLQKKGTARATSPLPVDLELVSLWAREPKEQPANGRAKDVIMSPSGKPLGEREYDLDLTEFERTRSRRNVRGVPIGESGQYWFRTQLWDEKRSKWQEVSNVPIKITIEVEEAKS
jgi:hypothetical protein